MSTHADEEIFCGKTHLLAKKTINDILTIIIPRHIDRIDEIYKKLKNLGLKIQIKKEEENINNFADVVLVNYYGSVNKYLKSVRQVFIGDSVYRVLDTIVENDELTIICIQGPFFLPNVWHPCIQLEMALTFDWAQL